MGCGNLREGIESYSREECRWARVHFFGNRQFAGRRASGLLCPQRCRILPRPPQVLKPVDMLQNFGAELGLLLHLVYSEVKKPSTPSGDDSREVPAI